MYTDLSCLCAQRLPRSSRDMGQRIWRHVKPRVRAQLLQGRRPHHRHSRKRGIAQPPAHGSKRDVAPTSWPSFTHARSSKLSPLELFGLPGPATSRLHTSETCWRCLPSARTVTSWPRRSDRPLRVGRRTPSFVVREPSFVGGRDPRVPGRGGASPVLNSWWKCGCPCASREGRDVSRD